MLVAWSALDFNGKTSGHGNNKDFYMQTIPSIVFQMFALFKILLKIRKMCAQSASLSIFPTDAFLLKLVGIDVQQAEVTGRNMFKHVFAIFGASWFYTNLSTFHDVCKRFVRYRRR